MARSKPAANLAKYRSMRDFDKTKEPSGANPPARAGNSFVIQKHAARRLHYFRLEHKVKQSVTAAAWRAVGGKP